jgi:hypothetical protein
MRLPRQGRQQPPRPSVPGDRGRAHVIEADDSLERLLEALGKDADPTAPPEDVAVWDGLRLMAVVRPDGTVAWMHELHLAG